MIDAGVDAVKVGIGPGSICTTRIVAGVGVPQLTAVMNCSQIADDAGVPVIADGGIRNSGDVAKALVAGASVDHDRQSLFAGLEESPGELIHYQGRTFKAVRGMGSLGAMMQGSKDRYAQSDVDERDKLVPEGVEGMVPIQGQALRLRLPVRRRCAFGHGLLRRRDVHRRTFREHAQLRARQSSAGLKESHPHDILITKEAPNYRGKDI